MIRALLVASAVLVSVVSAASAGGFEVTERAPAVCLVTVRHAANGDLEVSRADLTDPSTRRRKVEFDGSVLMHCVCTNSSWSGIESRIARTLVNAGGRFVDLSKSGGTAVRITSITLRGSVPEVTVETDPSAGSVVSIEGKTALTDPEWTPARSGHRFFRAVAAE